MLNEEAIHFDEFFGKEKSEAELVEIAHPMNL
jgi:hypothetical protein